MVVGVVGGETVSGLWAWLGETFELVKLVFVVGKFVDFWGIGLALLGDRRRKGSSPAAVAFSVKIRTWASSSEILD